MKQTDPNTVRDKLWIWAHDAGSHNGWANLSGTSRMTPAEAALYMGVHNVIMVILAGKPAPPFHQFALALDPFRRIIWSIGGDRLSYRNDLREVTALCAKHPNIRGAIIDDFFHNPKDPNLPAEHAGSAALYNPEDLIRFRTSLRSQAPESTLWVVLYQHDLSRPVQSYLQKVDGVTFWTWEPSKLRRLPESIRQVESLAPGKPILLGCYMWDYHTGRPMPRKLMELQCRQGLGWLREGRVQGLVFLASCICDLEIEAVEWCRDWIAEVGNEPAAGWKEKTLP